MALKRRRLLYDKRWNAYFILVAGQLMRVMDKPKTITAPVVPLTDSSPYHQWYTVQQEVETVIKGSTYSWAQTSGTPVVSFDSTSAEKPNITASEGGQCQLTCTIDAGLGTEATEIVHYWAMDDDEIVIRDGFLEDPSTIPADHAWHPGGAYATGQVSIADLTDTAISIYEPPTTTGTVETSDSLQGAVNAASDNQALLVKGPRTIDDISTLDLRNKNIRLVFEPGVEFVGVAILGTGGVQQIWNLKARDLVGTYNYHPMVRLGDGSSLIHGELSGATEVNFAFQKNQTVAYTKMSGGGQYNFNGASTDGNTIDYCEFEEGNAVFTDGSSTNKIDRGGMKFSKGVNNEIKRSLFKNNDGCSIWFDFQCVNNLAKSLLIIGRGVNTANDPYNAVGCEWNNIGGAAGRNIFEMITVKDHKSWAFLIRDGGAVLRYCRSLLNGMYLNIDTSSRMDSGDTIAELVEVTGNYVEHNLGLDGNYTGLLRMYRNPNGADVAGKIQIKDERYRIPAADAAVDYAKWINGFTTLYTASALVGRAEFTNCTVTADL